LIQDSEIVKGDKNRGYGYRSPPVGSRGRAPVGTRGQSPRRIIHLLFKLQIVQNYCRYRIGHEKTLKTTKKHSQQFNDVRDVA